MDVSFTAEKYGALAQQAASSSSSDVDGQVFTPLVGSAMAATCRILIVDDDQPVRETLADLLDISGFETVVAADAAEAVMILREPPGIDVLVTDLSMPGADGIVLIRQARMIQPDIPAILLTGYAEEAMSVSLAGNSNFHILRKPFEGSRLIEQIKILLDNRPTP